MWHNPIFSICQILLKGEIAGLKCSSCAFKSKDNLLPGKVVDFQDSLIREKKSSFSCLNGYFIFSSISLKRNRNKWPCKSLLSYKMWDWKSYNGFWTHKMLYDCWIRLTRDKENALLPKSNEPTQTNLKYFADYIENGELTSYMLGWLCHEW